MLPDLILADLGILSFLPRCITMSIQAITRKHARPKLKDLIIGERYLQEVKIELLPMDTPTSTGVMGYTKAMYGPWTGQEYLVPV